MKILHTADWHIGQFKGPVVDGVNLRLQDTVKCLEYMVEVAQKEKPDIVCISGDIFHQEQIGPVRYSDEMIIATDTITKLADIAKGVIVMRGTPNHDGSGQFRVLDRMFVKTSHVHIITAPTVLHTPYTDIACIPGFDKQEFRAKFPGLSADEENLAWTKYISDMVFALRAECEKTPILMAHYTVPGCNMESGQTSFFTNFEPVIPREALMAARYEAVLLGHIHRPQIIEGFDNVFYSGAINAMNFNDEGQERGFWIHEFNEKGTLVKGRRYTTPYRQFHTITWDPDEVGDYIREGAMYLHRTGISEEVTDKIVRVRYSCTSEQKKALNIPLLQKNLYELGAFYVADIEAESTIDITNRGLLSEESDPRLNLKKWLEEKTFKNPDKIVELAEPIIAEAMKQSTTAEIHGVFKPVSISVRNYRNYKEENFDFSDISFCTINGVNGAGKSSLFMDAIVDCLFEETREGDCKAWIRGTEDARSGFIEFIFDIGEKRFRVVRTRTKSGKPTLNLSQYQEESADWMNLSKERIIDTQAEIEKLLGMDSMTFRSCALIMQDQYGLFLQAKKDERIAILGNLLGLGIYGVMELDARKKLADSRKELVSKKEAVRIKTDFIKAQGKPEEELKTVEKDILKNLDELENLDESRRNLIERQEKISEAEKESEKIRSDLKECSEEYSAMANDLDHSKQTLTACNNLLELADVIREKAKQHSELSLQLSEVEKDVIKYKNAKRTLDSYNEDIDRYQRLIDKNKFRNKQIHLQISQLALNVPEDLEERLDALANERKEIESQQEKRYLYSTAQNELHEIDSSYSQKISGAVNRRDHRQKRISEIRQQEEFMKNSGCPDIESASCRFLSKAVEDVKSLPVELDNLKKCEEEIEILTSERNQKIADKQEKIKNIEYDPKRLAILTASVTELSKYERIKKDAEQNKLEIARLEAEKESNDKNITGCRHGCSYCYADKMSLRFCGNMKRNMVQTDQYRMEGDLFVLDEPFMNEDGKPVIYPFGFEPTLHIYRYDTLDKLKQGQNIFVGAMADIFGEWILDSWIEDVLYACAKHPQHNYLFLTKNPKRYTQYGVPSGKGNMWYGTTVTNSEDMERIYQLPSLLNTFASIEPLLEDIDENISALKYLNWIIIGAETGHRKEKVIPEFEWIKRIVVEADYNGIPVFMKDSLIPIVGEKNMRRDYPKELQIRKRSEKVNKKLSGNCMLCGKTEDKNKMVTLTARAVRGGKATSFGHMCHSCFAKWLTSHNIPVPDLENKKEIEDGKEKL